MGISLSPLHLSAFSFSVKESPSLPHIRQSFNPPEMAPRTRSSKHQEDRNDPERVNLLGDSCASPNGTASRRHGRNAPGISRRIKIRDAAKMTIRMRIRSQARGQQFSLLVGRPDIDRNGPTKKDRPKEETLTPEALRLDWMRRLRPKPHRRV
jgi:hypothetical protein